MTGTVAIVARVQADDGASTLKATIDNPEALSPLLAAL